MKEIELIKVKEIELVKDPKYKLGDKVIFRDIPRSQSNPPEKESIRQGIIKESQYINQEHNWAYLIKHGKYISKAVEENEIIKKLK